MKTLIAAIIGALCIGVSALHAQEPDRQIDSLKGELQKLPEHSEARMPIINSIYLLENNSDSILCYADKLMALAQANGSPYYELVSYDMMFYSYHHQLNYAKCFEVCFEGCLKSELYGDRKALCSFYKNLGTLFSENNDGKKGNEYLMKCISIADSVQGSELLLSECYRNIAKNNLNYGLFESAAKMVGKAQEIDEGRSNYEGIILDRNILSELYLFKYKAGQSSDSLAQNLRLSEQSSLEAIKIVDAQKLYHKIPSIYNNLAQTYIYLSKHEKGSAQKELIASAENLIDSAYQFENTYNMLGFYYDTKMIECELIIAKRDFKKAMALISQIESDTAGYYSDLEIIDKKSKYYEAVGDYKNAFRYKALYQRTYEENENNDYALDQAQKIAEQNYSRKLKEQENAQIQLQLEKELEFKHKNQKFLIAFAALMLIALVIFYYYRKTRKINKEISRQNAEISRQNKLINDSISYAQRIQSGVLPKKDILDSMFSDYFIIFRPKTIVSGDFYWASQIGSQKMFLAGDCTGHGVPGAFVSMLGISLLNQACNLATSGHNAAQILDDLRQKLMDSIHNQGDDSRLKTRDGMDVAFVMLDTRTRILQYAGANRPLWIVRNGTIIKYKADKMPIGKYHGHENPFTNNEIELQPEDTLYMFSDGVEDQFGYDDNGKIKKYSSKRLADLIISVSGKPMSEQQAIIESAMDSWKKDYEQLDDNLLVGVRF